MNPNISIFDTILRLFVGMIIGAGFAALYSPIGIIAFYPIVTALIAWDPIYQKMGWYTTEGNPYVKAESPKSAAASPNDNPYKMTA